MNLIPDDIDWSLYERDTEAASKVQPASLFLDEMMDELGKPEAREPCHLLPWEKTHRIFQLREGEVTLWAGVNNHGKSILTGQVAASLVCQAAPTCIASFEMKPKRSLYRMVRQFAGQDISYARPEEIPLLRDVYGDFKALCDEKLWFYNQQGTTDARRVLAVTRYCFKVLGIKHMVIDSLMKCVADEDDYNGQKRLVDELTALARDYSAHVHLVAHLRKGESEAKEPDKSDVKGTGAITDLVDNLMLVWRNIPKERQVEKGQLIKFDDPDTVIYCRKQRNGTSWNGPITLWFDKASQQYTGNPGTTMDMKPWPHVERAK